jgi:hypothetical protein
MSDVLILKGEPMSKPKFDPPLPRNGFGTTDLADPKELDLSPEQREKLTGISTYGLPRKSDGGRTEGTIADIDSSRRRYAAGAKLMGFLLIERSGDSPDRMADLAEMARAATQDYINGDAIVETLESVAEAYRIDAIITLDALCINSTRYCLGRQSYAVGKTATTSGGSGLR